MFSYGKYVAVILGSLVVSIGLQMLIPYPYGLGLSLAIFLAFPLIIRKVYNKQGMSSSWFGAGSSAVKYVCVICSNRVKGNHCNRCGSKMKRADF